MARSYAILFASPEAGAVALEDFMTDKGDDDTRVQMLGIKAASTDVKEWLASGTSALGLANRLSESAAQAQTAELDANRQPSLMHIQASYEITRLGYGVGVSLVEGKTTHNISKFISAEEVDAYSGSSSHLLRETAATLLRDLWLSVERAKSDSVEVGHRDLYGGYSYSRVR